MSLVIDFSDDLNRADAANLGANYTVGDSGSPIKIVSQRGRQTTLGTDAQEYLTAVSLPGDQFAQVDIVTANVAGFVPFHIRRSGALTDDGYLIICNLGAGTDIHVQPAFTQIAAETTTIWAAGDTARVEIIGSVISVYRIRSGVTLRVLQATNSTYTTGGVMFVISNNTGTTADVELDNLQAGHFAYDAPIFSQELSGACVGLLWQ